MRIDASDPGFDSWNWRVYDFAARAYRHDVAWVDDGTQEYGINVQCQKAAALTSRAQTLSFRSRVAIFPDTKSAIINLAENPRETMRALLEDET